MQKFTIFTIIMTVVVVVVAGELVMEEYLPKLTDGNAEEKTATLDLPQDLDLSKIIETNVLGAESTIATPIEGGAVAGSDQIDLSQLVYEEVPISEGSFSSGFEGAPIEGLTESEFKPSETASVIPSYESSSSGEPDFEDEGYNEVMPNVYIREDMLRSAGFASATLEEEPHNGFIFKTIYVADLPDTEVLKYQVKSGETLLAKIYVIQIGPEASVSEVYEVLKVRAAEGLDIEVNETNEFGNNSFFMNDARREGVAFLAVRFGPLLYGFSYPKEYHSQIKNLTKLIDYEF